MIFSSKYATEWGVSKHRCVQGHMTQHNAFMGKTIRIPSLPSVLGGQVAHLFLGVPWGWKLRQFIKSCQVVHVEYYLNSSFTADTYIWSFGSRETDRSLWSLRPLKWKGNEQSKWTRIEHTAVQVTLVTVKSFSQLLITNIRYRLRLWVVKYPRVWVINYIYTNTATK